MPPLASWYRGHDDLARFLRDWPLSGRWRWRHRLARANGQPAIGAYAWDERDATWRAFALEVLTLRGDRISEVTAFVTRAAGDPDRRVYAEWVFEPDDPARLRGAFERFGLPPSF
jgi:RNA polymerase sigma-70 factor (ECF subfamily)